MPVTSSKRNTLQTAISECGGQREKLRSFAEEIVSGLSENSLPNGENSLEVFISELVLSAADQRRRAERKRHQMECIAAAKKRGVRFGAEPKPLPDNFNEIHQAWRDSRMTLKEAADACGMPASTFYDAASRISGAKRATG